MLKSVGRADAAALHAILQLVPGRIEDVAKLVYQAPSEIAKGLRPDGAREVAELLGSLGFSVCVEGADTQVDPGRGEFEIALVVNDVTRLPRLIAETATFLGTDPTTARRVVCRSPAVMLSHVSEATVAAVRERFLPLGVDIDASHLSAARYYAVVALDSKAMRRILLDVIRSVVGESPIAETAAALTVSELDLSQAEALWERLLRTGARASICNRDLERYDVLLKRAPATPAMQNLLVELGIPRRLVARVLGRPPVVIHQNVSHEKVQLLLERVAAAGGEAVGLPYSFHRFCLRLRRIKDPTAVANVLASLGDLPLPTATAAAREGGDAAVGSFSRTTALWIEHTLKAQGNDVSIDLT